MVGWMMALALLAQAGDAAPAPCPATPAPLPAVLSGWQAMDPASAGASIATTPPMLAPGRSVRATLVAATMLHPAVPSTHVDAPGRFGGLFTLTVANAGRYRVALGSGAWIEMVQAQTPLKSVAHAHGPACSGIAKMVDFDLRPGRYVLQVTGSTTATLPVMVAMLPGS